MHYSPQESVSKMIFSNLYNVLEVKLSIGRVQSQLIREEGKSKHCDSLNAGLPAAIAYSSNIVKSSNSLGSVIKIEEKGWILKSYLFNNS